MKRNDLAQLKNLDEKTLLGRVKKNKVEVADLIMDKKMNKMKDLKSISKKRREIAVMLTIVRQKEMLMGLETSDNQTLDNKTKRKKGKKVN